MEIRVTTIFAKVLLAQEKITKIDCPIFWCDYEHLPAHGLRARGASVCQEKGAGKNMDMLTKTQLRRIRGEKMGPI
jgi:hypothetical protein